MSPVAHHLLDEDKLAGASPAQPASGEPGQPVRILPIAGLTGFITLTAVVARIHSRLADLAGVIMFAALHTRRKTS
jgi:hypothetical protein